MASDFTGGENQAQGSLFSLENITPDTEEQQEMQRRPQNFAVIRQIALILLKNEKTARGGVQAKRLQAAWDEDTLLKVLAV